MIRGILLIFVGVTTMQSSMLLAAKEPPTEKQIIAFVDKFLSRIDCDTPFTYDEEKEFFGFSISSVVLLSQAKYIREDGTWIKREPESSLLGNLLLQKKDIFQFPSSDRNICFFKSKGDSSGYVLISYTKVYKSGYYGFEGQVKSKCILLSIKWYNKLQICLDNSMINGQGVPFLLGFKMKDIEVMAAGEMQTMPVPYFPDSEFRKIFPNETP